MTERIAALSVHVSGSSSGTDKASLPGNQYCMQESVQGRRFGGQVVDDKIVIIGVVVTQRQGSKRENFWYGGHTKNWRKGGKLFY